MSKQLSIIIPFLNEGKEIFNTIKSINKYCKQEMYTFIIINDCSDYDYDYDLLKTFPNVLYIKNSERKGVAGSRDIGALHAQTKYILFLDAHMRVYSDVVSPLLFYLDKYQNSLLCCQSQVIDYDKENKQYYIFPNPKSKGCYLYTNLDNRFLSYTWDELSLDDISKDVIPIKCVMGACYAMSTEFYRKIHGLNGLQQYGFDEQFLSAKTFMTGNEILLLKNIEIAHIYRTNLETVYSNNNNVHILNKLILLYLFDKSMYLEFISKNKISQECFDFINELRVGLDKESEYLKLIFVKQFKDYLLWNQIH